MIGAIAELIGSLLHVPTPDQRTSAESDRKHEPARSVTVPGKPHRRRRPWLEILYLDPHDPDVAQAHFAPGGTRASCASLAARAVWIGSCMQADIPLDVPPGDVSGAAHPYVGSMSSAVAADSVHEAEHRAEPMPSASHPRRASRLGCWARRSRSRTPCRDHVESLASFDGFEGRRPRGSIDHGKRVPRHAAGEGAPGTTDGSRACDDGPRIRPGTPRAVVGASPRGSPRRPPSRRSGGHRAIA